MFSTPGTKVLTEQMILCSLQDKTLTGLYLTTVKPQSHDVPTSCLPVLCFVHEVSTKILSLFPMASININIVEVSCSKAQPCHLRGVICSTERHPWLDGRLV